VSYGGHSMASRVLCGARKPVPAGTEAQHCGSAGGKYFPPPLQLDGYLQLRELSTHWLQTLNAWHPSGPVTRRWYWSGRQMRLSGYSVVGRHQEHLQVSVEDDWGEHFR